MFIFLCLLISLNVKTWSSVYKRWTLKIGFYPFNEWIVVHWGYISICYLYLFVHFKYLFTYLEGLVIERDKQRQRKENIPSASSLPIWLQWPGLGQVKVRNQELQSSLLCGCRCHLHCFSRLISREQDWKCNRKDSN